MKLFIYIFTLLLISNFQAQKDLYHKLGNYYNDKESESFLSKELIITNPNGGEILIVGEYIDITWSGGEPSDKVRIDYSTDNGKNWILIHPSAKGLTYRWNIANTPSNICLFRVAT